MLHWLLIPASALLGGLLLLSTFGQTKEASERMLKVYENLLNEALKQRDRERQQGREA